MLATNGPLTDLALELLALKPCGALLEVGWPGAVRLAYAERHQTCEGAKALIHSHSQLRAGGSAQVAAMTSGSRRNPGSPVRSEGSSSPARPMVHLK